VSHEDWQTATKYPMISGPAWASTFDWDQGIRDVRTAKERSKESEAQEWKEAMRDCKKLED
jgi:hypothetical protein